MYKLPWTKIFKTSSVSALLISIEVFAPAAGGQVKVSQSNHVTQSQHNQNLSARAPKVSANRFDQDTLIITLAPGADQDKTKEILEDVHGTVVNTLHINRDNYDILFVKAEPGKVDETLAKLRDKKNKNFKSIERNTVRQRLQAVPPNDPDFSAQWNLYDLNWPQAQVAYINSQTAAPRITICDTGYEPYRTNGELSNVLQYDCTGGSPVSEAPHDVEGHGTNCSSIAAAQTDNGTLIVGVASLSTAHPAQVTMLRISTDASGTATDTAIITALTWAINNQTNTAVSLSFGSTSGVPLWSAAFMQTLGTSLNNEGSHLFEAAGNSGIDQSSYPEGSITVVQATDQDDDLASFSNTLATPEAAPGVNIPDIWGYSGGAAYAQASGTSESTPTYAACAALLQSIAPNLTIVQATQILGQTAKTTSQGKQIPQLDIAILVALGGTPPPPQSPSSPPSPPTPSPSPTPPSHFHGFKEHFHFNNSKIHPHTYLTHSQHGHYSFVHTHGIH